MQFHTDCEGCNTRLQSIFNNLSKEELNRFSKCKSCMSCENGQIIFEEGGHPRGLYIVNSGKIKISKYCEAGKEQIMRLANKGDIIGYRALLSSELYACSATAVNKTSLCFIPKDNFLGLITSNGELALKMMKLLSYDLKMAEKKISHLTHKTIRERVAESLLLLKETYGYCSDNVTINIDLNRAEIASLVGTTRETVTRMLYEFKDDGLLELNEKKIAIINHKQLLKTANIFH